MVDRMKEEYVPREIIANKLLIALEENDDQVAIVVTEKDLRLMLVAFEAVLMECDEVEYITGIPVDDFRQWLVDMRQFQRALGWQ